MQSKSYILLTGATSDIGSAIARTLCGEYPLLLHGRTQEKLQALKDELQSPNPVELWRADLSETEILKPSLKEFLTSKQIPVSGFVHCAGTLKIMAFKHFREDYIREIFDVNLFSAIAVLQALLTKNNLPFMNRVVFISSLSSRRGDKGNTMYASSKGAIDALVRSLAIELAPDINVNSVLPGTIQTKMTEHLFEDATAQSPYDASKYPVGPGKCSDIASMVQFLLGEGGRWITAQNYRVDGGASTF